MRDQSSTIHVRIAPGNSESRGHGPEARQAFWRYVSEMPRYPNARMLEPDEFERRVRRDFGKAMKRALVNYLAESLVSSSRTPHPGEETTSVLTPTQSVSGVFFEVQDVSYGSLELSVAVAGIGELARVFNENSDLFTMFLNAYVPQAFADVVEPFDVADRCDFEVQLPAQFVQEFGGQSPAGFSPGKTTQHPPGKEEKSKGLDRARWLWIAANTSLVLPFLLAIAVLYVAFVGMNEERAAIRESARRLMETSERRTADLESKQLRLIEILMKGSEPRNLQVNSGRLAPSPSGVPADAETAR